MLYKTPSSKWSDLKAQWISWIYPPILSIFGWWSSQVCIKARGAPFSTQQAHKSWEISIEWVNLDVAAERVNEPWKLTPSEPCWIKVSHREGNWVLSLKQQVRVNKVAHSRERVPYFLWVWWGVEWAYFCIIDELMSVFNNWKQRFISGKLWFLFPSKPHLYSGLDQF